ncbi:hypothetical protein ACHOLT_07485 [Desulfitobacterium sp. Sab5]|uniref:hypothetical protein n=1 Tax=Desulfitobacterium nosdiversum TaxID=3375356 RepID=UPI003CF65B98
MMRSKILDELISGYQVELEKYEEFSKFALFFEKELEQEIETEKLKKYMIEREVKIAEIKEREAHNILLKNQLCEILNVSEFTIINFKDCSIDSKKLDQLNEWILKIEDTIKSILVSDQRIQDKLKMEKEATKLELHRIQSFKRAKNAYSGGETLEAQFIDKNK